MKIVLLLLAILSMCRTVGLAQMSHGRPRLDHSHDTDRRGGNAERAISARHHLYSGNVLKVQLGYIDTSTATLQEMLDNSWVGLVVVPESKYKIVGFRLDVGPPHMDTKAVYIKGNKFTAIQYFDKLGCNGDYANLLLKECTPGYTLYFSDIRAKKEGSNNEVPLKDFKIRITR